MCGGKVDVLVILGGNPAYDAPADFGFRRFLKSGSVPLRIHHGLYQDETAELCHWHVNAAHYLEIVGRCACLRRHGKHRPATDCATL